MQKPFFLFLFIFSFTFSGSAQKIEPFTTAEAAGFSASRLQRVDNLLNDWVKQGRMQGATALVIHNGKIAYSKAIGYNDLEAKTPMQKDNIFRIASQTKAVTSVAIMMLFEEGKLKLDDPVSKYIPSFKNQTVLDKFNKEDTSYTTVPAKSPVTIRHLLTHTSGIGYAQIGSPEANAIYAKNNITAGIGVNDISLLEAMTRLGKLPLMHQPGEKWTYGLNTDLLGGLVEIISGTTLSEFFRTRIFEPLGMKDSYFRVPAAKASRLVHLYQEDSVGKLQKADLKIFNGPAMANYPLEDYTYYSGGAGLSTTIYDYGVFLQMLLNGGLYDGKRILSRNAVRLMTMNQIGDLPFGDDKFGLGFSVVTERGSSKTMAREGTFGWGGAFATSYWVDPKENLVILLYRNLFNTSHWEDSDLYLTLVYAALNK